MPPRERFPRNARPFSELAHVPWQILESPLESYVFDFRSVLPEEEMHALIVQTALRRQAVYVDLLGSVQAMKDLSAIYRHISDDIDFRAAVFHHPDRRSNEQKRLDETEGIRVFDMDINRYGQVCKLFRSWLSESYVDCFFERGYGGLHYVGHSPRRYQLALDGMWRHLHPDGGLMLLMTPPFDLLRDRGIPIDSLIEDLNKNEIYVRTAPFHKGLSRTNGGYAFDYGLLMLRKDHPDQALPVIETV